MRLSEIDIENINVHIDGEFELLAQCIIKKHKKILSFLSDDKYINQVLNNANITCIICKKEHIELFKKKTYGIIISENPKLTFFRIHNAIFNASNLKHTSIDSSATISKSAIIASNNVVIEKNVIIEDNVVIKENVIIGEGTIIRAGCVIGGQGYEFKKNCNIDILRVNHCGKTIIGRYVELKEYVTIHQAVFDWDNTIIDDHSKLDAHTHIGHASKIAKRVMLGSHSNVAGNVEIGNDVYVGPGVTISNRLIIGNNARINIGSVVTKNVSESSSVTGNFAIPHEIFISNLKAKL